MAVKERKQPRRQCEKPPKIRTRAPTNILKLDFGNSYMQIYSIHMNLHASNVPNTLILACSWIKRFRIRLHNRNQNCMGSRVFFGISMELRFPPTKTVRLPALTWYDGGKDKTKSNSGPTQHNSFASLWVLSCLRVSVFKHVALPDGPKGWTFNQSFRNQIK